MASFDSSAGSKGRGSPAPSPAPSLASSELSASARKRACCKAQANLSSASSRRPMDCTSPSSRCLSGASLAAACCCVTTTISRAASAEHSHLEASAFSGPDALASRASNSPRAASATATAASSATSARRAACSRSARRDVKLERWRPHSARTLAASPWAAASWEVRRSASATTLLCMACNSETAWANLWDNCRALAAWSSN
mmetsp:Transcript_108646/g.292185  ORF Transcript_108646/g.292185 Transcript_108646/m.292185 type:complete len:201 (-) Transcript_108646:307-909(-)